ncbi:MAG TPA: hypothetical protein VGO09_09595 [Flavisolibacter sp.]|jgi:hypothetical protein|nr:hypothetical protein [Flavisolibacter sp.]
MSESLKDILSNLSPDIDQETLLLYLQGKLSAIQQHELEKNMLDNDFDLDAFEGLNGFTDKKNISLLVEQLNKELKAKTAKKKKFKEKIRLKLDPWTIIMIVLILALVVVSFIVIYKKVHGR